MFRHSRIFLDFANCLVLSLFIVLFLFWLIFLHRPDPDTQIFAWLLVLPTFNAICNALSGFYLVRAVYFISKGKSEKHKSNIYTALGFLVLFLLGYILFYSFYGDRAFIAEGEVIRRIYYSILISHVSAAIVALPMIMHTFSLSRAGLLTRHRKFARKTFPLWLYVNVTGVIIYILFNIYC